MDKDEMNRILVSYAYKILTYEEMHGFGSPEKFHEWVKEHVIPIGKSELEMGKEYSGECRTATRTVWDGKNLHIQGTSLGQNIRNTSTIMKTMTDMTCSCQ